MIQITVKIDGEEETITRESVLELLKVPHKLRHMQNQLGVIQQNQEKIMAEIDDLNAKVDQLNTAVSGFDGVLQSAVTAIQTEISQLASMAQAATDLAALKAGVAAATDKLTPAVEGIGTASATLQTQVDALAADDAPVV